MSDPNLKYRLEGIDPLSHEELDGNFRYLDEKVEPGQNEGSTVHWVPSAERWKETTDLIIAINGDITATNGDVLVPSGKVGISTTNPIDRFHTELGDGEGIALGLRGNNGTFYLGMKQDTNQWNNAGYLKWEQTSNINDLTINAGGGSIKFVSTNQPYNEGMVIDASGIVNIAPNITLGGTGTIAGATWSNGTFHLGNSTAGWAMDPNELFNSGSSVIGTLAGTLSLNPATKIIVQKPIESGSTITSGAVTINADGDALNIRGVSGVSPVRATFSSHLASNNQQIGHIEYNHVDTGSYGSAESFTIGGNQSSITVLADGKLMFRDGIYKKPASGTGAGTRKDANWDTAYAYSQVGHLPLSGGTISGNLTINSGGHTNLIVNGNGGSAYYQNIHVGESGAGSAALHMQYRGDGYAWIGMGETTAGTTLMAYAAMQMQYQSNDLTILGNLKLNEIDDAPQEWNPALLEDGGWVKKDAAVRIHGAGYLQAVYLNMTHASATRNSDTIFFSTTDDYIRKNNAAGMRTSLNVPTRTGGNASGTWGIAITGNAGSATTATLATSADTQNIFRADGVAVGPLDFKQQSKWKFTEQGQLNSPPGSGSWRHVNTIQGWTSYSSSYPSYQVSYGNGAIGVRQSTSGTAWGAWRTLIDSSNYNTYAPTLTGTGATGTWGINITGNATWADTVDVNDSNANNWYRALWHSGDTVYSTSGVKIHPSLNALSASRYYIGNGYLDAVAGNYGTFNITGAIGSSGTYSGYAINDRVVFMNNGGTTSGIYNDTNDEWFMTFVENGSVDVYYNGAAKMTTISTGIQVKGTLRVTDQKAYVANNYGHGIFGVYSATRYQHVWSMGEAYTVPADGSGTGNMYGLTYTHTNVGTGTNESIAGLSHQLQHRTNGVLTAAIGTGIWTSGNISAYSDISVKENIVKIGNAIDKVKQINGYTYDRIDIKKQNENLGEDMPTRQAGVIAQEVEKVLPEVVSGEDGSKAVSYGNMVSLLIEAIKEQQSQIEQLGKEVSELRGL